MSPMMMAGIGCILISIGLFLYTPSPRAKSATKKPKAKVWSRSAGHYPLDLLAKPPANKEPAAKAEGSKLIVKMNRFFDARNINAFAASVITGPCSWTFNVEMPIEVGTEKVTNSKTMEDLSRILSKPKIMVLPVRDGGPTLELQITRLNQKITTLPELLTSKEYFSAKGSLVVPIGSNAIDGSPVIVDLVNGPHTAIFGETGSGKSGLINLMLLGLIYKYGSDELQLTFFDPKSTELTPYNGIPHLTGPVITGLEDVPQVLQAVIDDMTARNKLLASHGKRKISELPKKIRPPIRLVVLEEFSQMTNAKTNPDYYAVTIGMVQKLAELARSSGIYLMIILQTPTVDNFPGSIRNNTSGLRIGGKVSTSRTSDIGLGFTGAEDLGGCGDMLAAISGERVRFKTPFVTSKEVGKIVKHIIQNHDGDSIPKPTQAKAPPSVTETQTSYLRMQFDHTGGISGTVVSGHSAGQALGDLSAEALSSLLAECVGCADSIALIEGFITYHGLTVTQKPQAEIYRELFDLQAGFTPQQLKKAWRQVRAVVHPDRGGSDEAFIRHQDAYNALMMMES